MSKIDSTIYIIYLEKNPEVLEGAIALLSDYGFQVKGVTSNDEAIAECLKRMPSCILASFTEDHSIGGATFCYALRSNNEFKSIPVILISDSLSSENITVGLSSGASDILLNETMVDILVLKILGAAANRKTQLELQELRRVNAIQSLVATYNHEINNPLTISLGHLRKLKKVCPQEGMKSLEAVERGLDRIREIVKKISQIEDSEEVDYVGGAKMIQLKTGSD